ncbi:fungal-specific transcription factor domain-containing protein [Plectosphaerella plurivora]|uniref:Fungal-specific transcription factor domain-containing protein n=1 Tax=Plectosphaerella plurivora TaxID=936078 RepID=A0A9P8VLB1_9PEZI|nr:fungal-specific transcription factor domain-containing protein [Plectosphaerella plurivora]
MTTMEAVAASPSARTVMSASGKKPRRLLAACLRCHSQKIKCSGDSPCRACISSNKAADCHFPSRERKVTVSESYLRRLEKESKRLHGSHAGPSQQPTPDSRAGSPLGRATGSGDDMDMLNPMFDKQSESRKATEPSFIGEASCAAFNNRLLQCLDANYTPSTPGFTNYFRPPATRRVPMPGHEDAADDANLPDRMHARLLLNLARSFIGNYHPLFLEKAFMAEVDAFYRQDQSPSQLWLCKFLALMALGEVYSNRRRVGDSNRVPGTAYYVRAVQMLPDSFEEPSLLHVEVLTLLAWAANLYGSVRTAFIFSGDAMRLATSLGMHRSVSARSSLTPVERETRRRTWWVLYFFDRFSASKLGQPVFLRDEDIDVELPSMDGLTEEEQQEFLDPAPLAANVRLARIIGNILTDIYGVPSRNNKGLCLHRVHSILKQLRAWHDGLPPSLRINDRGTPRPVASLYLAYNQCIIQTTRPVLLHLFKTQYQLGGSEEPRRDSFSSITLALAESCIGAAQASGRVVEALFLNGTIATFGYWDAHHIFSAALVLIMSAVMKPTPAASDALEMMLSILRSMRDSGNIPAVEFCERLGVIQARVAELRASMGGVGAFILGGARDGGDGNEADHGRESRGDEAHAPRVAAGADSNPHGGPAAGPSSEHYQAMHAGPLQDDGYALPYGQADILGNPLIGRFLDEGWVPSWPDSAFAKDGALGDLATELEEQFLFQMS